MNITSQGTSIRPVAAAYARMACGPFLLILVSLALVMQLQSASAATDLQTSANGRYITDKAGNPFFWKGDTVWTLHVRYTDAEVEQIIADRKAKGFNVIQMFLAMSWFPSNLHGDYPFVNGNPLVLNERYFERVKWVVSRLRANGIHAAIALGEVLRTDSPWRITTPAAAYENGRLIGRALGSYNNIVWLGGQDFNPVSPVDLRTLIRAQMEGVADGINGINRYDGVANFSTSYMGFHPKSTSSPALHSERWLDFNAVQTWRLTYYPYTVILAGYNKLPVKPIINLEPPYEARPVGGGCTPYDVRRFAYWSMFSGGAGHTYGHYLVYGGEPGWQLALNAPGVRQFGSAMSLIRSKPILTRIPDQSMLVSGNYSGPDYIAATRDSQGRYAFIYTPTGRPFTVRMSKISSATVQASWMNPATGSKSLIGRFSNSVDRGFTPPTTGYGKDWVLVLEAL